MNKIKNILIFGLLVLEIIICFFMGLDASVLVTGIKYYLISHVLIVVIFLIIFNVLPLISIPELSLEPEDKTFGQCLKKWYVLVAVVIVNFLLVMVFCSVIKFWKIIPVLIFGFNIVLSAAYIAGRRVKANTSFAYSILKIASTDKKKAASLFMENPQILDVMIGFLPFGFVAQFGLEQVKDKVLEMKKKKNPTKDELSVMADELSADLNITADSAVIETLKK